jgi:hypothetical protein
MGMTMRIEYVAALIGVLGALAGTYLGAWVTGRSQRNSLDMAFVRERLRQREAAYVDFLAAIRQFRRFLLTSGNQIQLLFWLPGSAPGIPRIEGDDKYWEALETAVARLRISIDDRTVQDAADNSVHYLYELARAMAKQGPDTIPEEALAAARKADREFEDSARAHLGSRAAVAGPRRS